MFFPHCDYIFENGCTYLILSLKVKVFCHCFLFGRELNLRWCWVFCFELLKSLVGSETHTWPILLICIVDKSM